MSIIFDGTKGITLPNWTTENRPASPSDGQFGFNTTLSVLEIYSSTSGQWSAITPTPTQFLPFLLQGL